MAIATNASQGPPTERPRPKATQERPPVRPEQRADQQRKRAGRAAYEQPVNMGMSDPIVSAKKVLTGAGGKVDTEG